MKNTKKQAALKLINDEIRKAMEDMFPLGSGRVGDTVVLSFLKKLTQQAFEEGQNYTLHSLMDIEDVATVLGVSTRRVRAIAVNRHQRHDVGWRIRGSGRWLFTPDDLEILKPRKYRRRK